MARTSNNPKTRRRRTVNDVAAGLGVRIDYCAPWAHGLARDARAVEDIDIAIRGLYRVRRVVDGLRRREGGEA